MARETKVGLLAGLAFIICFAIILANRGQTPRPAVPQPLLVDQARPAPRTTERPNTLGSARRVPAAARPMAGQTRAQVSTGPIGDRVASETRKQNRAADLSPREDSVSAVFPKGEHATNVAGYGHAVASTGATIPGENESADTLSDLATSTGLSSVTTPAGNPALYGPPPSMRTQQDLLREKLALAERLGAGLPIRRAEGEPVGELAPVSIRPVDPTPVNQKAVRRDGGGRPTSGTRRGGVRYVVVQGDSLSKIVKAHYGTGSTRLINAVFAANRSVMSDPNVLKVGMELALPRLELDRGSRRRSASPARDKNRTSQTARATTVPRANIRWYQVRKNDRYVSIAREQLGDGSRWREIYELNKDKFPDPDSIRAGVRIRLPATTVARNTRS